MRYILWRHHAFSTRSHQTKAMERLEHFNAMQQFGEFEQQERRIQ
jgi:hypothetical protein